jgi:isoquinoline 1-oxidoreductase beta subunit
VQKVAEPVQDAPPGPELNAWVAIRADDVVDLTIPEAEMGQGSTHALALVLADELGVDFDRVRVHLADADVRFGRQSTGGSSSIRQGHDAIRGLGAAAREMLVAAAAARWGVEVGSCTARAGAVHHTEHGSLGYGALAAEAAALPVPDAPSVKPAAERRLAQVPRWDLRPKVRGEATFGLDVRVPDMVFAAIARPPRLGATLREVGDDSAARAVPGVIDVIVVEGIVAVLARDTWSAFRGRDALQVAWEPGPHTELSTERVREVCTAALSGGAVARDQGDARAALRKAARTLEATFEAPYLAHATMEPLSCTAHVADGRCEVWVATQSPTSARGAAAKAAGVPEDAVSVHATFLGGGFGRRSNTDFVDEAVRVAKVAGRPVQVVWSREDDTRGGRYRPFSVHRLRAGLDADGKLIAWDHALACPSILASMGRGEPGSVDPTSTEGAANLPYAVPNLRVTAASPQLPVSVWFWRSVGSSQNAWVTECFVDELAALAGADPVAFRLGLLADHPRHARALKLAADKAGWGTPLAEGRARGVAVHESFGSFCAQVAEVSLDGSTPRVHRVTCVIDCGQAVTPDAVEVQMHSSIAYGLSAALWGRIDLEGGAVVQSNFHDYRALRFDEMPVVDVTILTEGEPFGGVGEPGTPPIAPAVCNALRVLTGEPVRRLPIVG